MQAVAVAELLLAELVALVVMAAVVHLVQLETMEPRQQEQ
jgi:hypothetical protein